MLGYGNWFRGIYYLSDRTASGKSYLTVTAQKCTEKGTEKAVVYQYQPRDCLYREIVSKCPMNVGGRQKVEQEGGRQRWMVFTGEGQSGVLMAFSLFYAWMLSETKKVLYVNFTECSGMTELFELVEQPEDFSDFLLALRSFPGMLYRADR